MQPSHYNYTTFTDKMADNRDKDYNYMELWEWPGRKESETLQKVMLHKEDCINAAIVLRMVGDLSILPWKSGEETSSRSKHNGRHAAAKKYSSPQMTLPLWVTIPNSLMFTWVRWDYIITRVTTTPDFSTHSLLKCRNQVKELLLQMECAYCTTTNSDSYWLSKRIPPGKNH